MEKRGAEMKFLLSATFVFRKIFVFVHIFWRFFKNRTRGVLKWIIQFYSILFIYSSCNQNCLLAKKSLYRNPGPDTHRSNCGADELPFKKKKPTLQNGLKRWVEREWRELGYIKNKFRFLIYNDFFYIRTYKFFFSFGNVFLLFLDEENGGRGDYLL